MFQPHAKGPGLGSNPPVLPRYLAKLLLFGPSGTTYLIVFWGHLPAAVTILSTLAQSAGPLLKMPF
jgi:hypothetical protein